MSTLISETSVPLEEPASTLAGAEPAPAEPPWKRLDFTVQRQLQSQWCWSAVSVSIDDFYRRPTSWTQCDLVGAEFGREDCCQNGEGPACNQPWYVDRALTRMGIFAGLEQLSPPSRELWPSAMADIEAGRPVGLRIGWDGGGGHAIVMEGFRSDGAIVALEDPHFGASEVPLALLDRYQGTGTMTHLFHSQP